MFQTTKQYKNNLSLLGMVQGYGSYPSEVYESWLLIVWINGSPVGPGYRSGPYILSCIYFIYKYNI